MALPWQIPLGCAPLYEQKPKSFEPSLLKHNMNLRLEDVPLDVIQTGLMCDIDLKIYDTLVIKKIIEAGVTILKINIQEADLEFGDHHISCLREAVTQYSQEVGRVYPVAVILDINGPKIVTGNLRHNYIPELISGGGIRLTTQPSWKDLGDADCLYMEYDNISELHQGDIIIIDNSSNVDIQLVIERVGTDSLICKVITGGQIIPKMPVRIIKHNYDRKSLKSTLASSTESSCSEVTSESDCNSFYGQISWGVNAEVDAMLLYDVESARDVYYVKKLLGDKCKDILIFVSIDNESVIENYTTILPVTDGIFFDRTRLSGSVGVSKIFVAQKLIMAKCKEVGKPCICKIVINEELPAICVTDIANIVIDGATGLFLQFDCGAELSGEVPKYNCLQTAKKCISAVRIVSRYAEKITWQPGVYNKSDLMDESLENPALALCMSAIEMAMSVKAVAIICLTNYGKTARMLTFIKPPFHLIAVTKTCRVARQLRFFRGLRVVHYFPKENKANEYNEEEQILLGLQYCKEKRILQAGNPYVVLITNSHTREENGSIRLLYASANNTICSHKLN